MNRRTTLVAKDVHRYYPVGNQQVRALEGVSVRIAAGEGVGIAGESGSGKSTLLRLLLCLEPVDAGGIEFDGKDLSGARHGERIEYRKQVQAVFQDPGGSLNPRHRVWKAVTEPLASLYGLDKAARKQRAPELLASVELPGAYAWKYPHQLSGGERQRVVIARALSCDPSIVLLDEPVTALDVSVRGHILNILNARKWEDGLGFATVSHDLTTIYYVCDHLYVMYRGRVVEEGPVRQVIEDPKHPYTQYLVKSIEDPLYEAPAQDEGTALTGVECRFADRCPERFSPCDVEPPFLMPVPDRHVRCYLYDPAQASTSRRDERGPVSGSAGRPTADGTGLLPPGTPRDDVSR